MNDDTLKALEAELQRQNEMLKELESELASLGDVEIGVPEAFFEELDELCETRTTTLAAPIVGIRG